jgi:hypothetical protein
LPFVVSSAVASLVPPRSAAKTVRGMGGAIVTEAVGT